VTAPASPPAGQSGLAPTGAVDSVISVAAFMIGNRVGGLGLAIAASTAWTLKASISRHRKGLAIGKLLPITGAYLVARGLVGVLTDSKALYFGIGIGTQAAIGLALIVSVVVGRSLLGELVPRVLPFPVHVPAHRIFRRTMAHLTILAGSYQLAKSGWDIWLYQNSSTNGFVLLRFVAGWLTGVVAITGGLIYADRRLKRIEGFDGLVPMLEVMNAPRKPIDG
jgi:hypothetical protein